MKTRICNTRFTSVSLELIIIKEHKETVMRKESFSLLSKISSSKNKGFENPLSFKKIRQFFRPFLFFNVFSIPLAKRISNVERNVEDTTTMVFRAVHRGERGGKRVVVSTFGKREVKNFQLRATLSLPVKISSHVSPRFFLLFFFLLYISLLSRIIFFSHGGREGKMEEE